MSCEMNDVMRLALERTRIASHRSGWKNRPSMRINTWVISAGFTRLKAVKNTTSSSIAAVRCIRRRRRSRLVQSAPGRYCNLLLVNVFKSVV